MIILSINSNNIQENVKKHLSFFLTWYYFVTQYSTTRWNIYMYIKQRWKKDTLIRFHYLLTKTFEENKDRNRLAYSTNLTFSHSVLCSFLSIWGTLSLRVVHDIQKHRNNLGEHCLQTQFQEALFLLYGRYMSKALK